MKLNIKQVVFVLTGLVIIIATFFFYKSNYAKAAKKNGKKFGDWTVLCVTQSQDSNEPQRCFLRQFFVQKITDENGKKHNVNVAAYEIEYNLDDNIVMHQILPLGVALESGTSILASKDLVATGTFSTCINTKCQARTILSDEQIKKIAGSKQAAVAVMDFVSGRQLVIPINTKGLEEGLKYLKKK